MPAIPELRDLPAEMNAGTLAQVPATNARLLIMEAP
jgi:hypothetical protein